MTATISVSNIQNNGSVAPSAQIRRPDHVSWHLVQDSELDMLTNKEAGVFGAIGFATFGSALGVLPQMIASVDKIGSADFNNADLWAFIIFAGSIVAMVICLTSFFWNKSRNSDIKKQIRERGSVAE